MKKSITSCVLLISTTCFGAGPTAWIECKSLVPLAASASDSADPQVATAVVCPVKNAIGPDYPAYAQRNNIRGTVHIKVIVEAAGTVEEIKVVSSPHPSLSNAVLRAVKEWEFPARPEKYSASKSFTF